MAEAKGGSTAKRRRLPSGVQTTRRTAPLRDEALDGDGD